MIRHPVFAAAACSLLLTAPVGAQQRNAKPAPSPQGAHAQAPHQALRAPLPLPPPPPPVQLGRGDPSRQAPQRFEPHPPGRHERGPEPLLYPARVLAPRFVVHGSYGWGRWEHPAFARPVYYWDWPAVRSVSCIAADSYGDQYPVTETAIRGFGLAHMTAVEDAALDRCYAESGQDSTCYLASCSHF
jgi:hypothetical protein